MRFVHSYRKHINPPYSRTDLPAILATLLVIVVLALGIILYRKFQSDRTHAAASTQVVFVNLQTLQPEQIITNPEVGVVLTAPWPIAFNQNRNMGEVAGDSSTKSKLPSKSNPTKIPVSPLPTTPSAAAIIVSIVLAQDSALSQNVMTISPVTSNPFLAKYTFSSDTPGIKTLYAKFVSSRGDSLTYSSSIELVSPDSRVPTPVVSNAPLPPSGSGGIQPFADAPLCPDSGIAHNTHLFHTLWDSVRGCHYDHEHGQNPFSPEVAAIFPDFDLYSLLGNVGVAHTNHSSPLENTQKHGGFKWNVQLTHPEGCAGFEGATNGVNGSVIQYHSFGDEGIELEARVHSATALVRQCNTTNPTDYGYLYVVQFQDYGQRVVPYQGTVVPYPNQPAPGYDGARGPYLSTDCVNGNVPQCRTSLQDVVDHHRNVASVWTSKPTGLTNTTNPFGSKLFQLLFRTNDGYRLFDWNDQAYPFTFLWVCSTDGGLTYNPVGCRYNNSTSQVHEIAGKVPAAWDNLAGFDSDARVGRITAQGFVSQFGDLDRECTAAGPNCFPIKMVKAFVGSWGSVLVYTPGKSNNNVSYEPSRNIYFCNGQVCSENDPGAVPSGWIGQAN